MKKNLIVSFLFIFTIGIITLPYVVFVAVKTTNNYIVLVPRNKKVKVGYVISLSKHRYVGLDDEWRISKDQDSLGLKSQGYRNNTTITEIKEDTVIAVYDNFFITLKNF